MTIVSSGSTLTVSSGQTSSYLGVLSGGTLGVLAGGTVISTSLLGTETLRGVDSAGQVSSGGVLSVSAGGTVQGGSVLSSGAETVFSAGTVSGGMVASGGVLTVSAGGLVSGTAVHGTATVLSGGVASATAISASGTGYPQAEEIVSGGQSVSATVGSGGELLVSGVTSTTYNGSAFVNTVVTPASASNTTVSTGGYLYVETGGVTTGTVLLGNASSFGIGGEEVVTGSALGTTINSGGEQFVYSGGTTSGTLVASGGTQILNGGTALNDVVSAGGIVSFSSGTLAFTEAAGATSSFVGTVSGGTSSAGMLVQSGPGTLALAGNLSGFTGSAMISGGTLELTSAGAAGSAAIGFALGTSATLRIDGATGPANTIVNFTTGDVIDLHGLAYAGTTAPSVSGNTVTVTEGSASETLVITGAAADTFALASDGSGGTRVTDTAPKPVVSSGSTLTVSSGQTSSYLGVLSGGTLAVLAGGTVISTSLLGAEALHGVDSAGQVSSGGVLSVSAGGLVQGGSVLSSGAETVSSAGIANGDMVASGGLLTVSAGGLVSGTAVHGTLTVLSGGVASATAINLSGTSTFGAEEIVSGGQSVSATVGSGGELVVSGVSSTTYNGSAFVNTVVASASASNTTVSAGGYLYVDAGGVTTGTVLLGSTGGTGSFTFAIVGEESVAGSALGTVVSSGGEQLVYSGGTSGTVVASGGVQILSGGTALNDVVSAGGIVSAVGGVLAFTETATSSFVGTVTGSASSNVMLVQSGPGTLALAGNLSGFTGSAMINGGTLELTSAGAAGSAAIGFALGSSGTLRIDGATGPANTIYNFNSGDVIDLGGLAYAGTAAPSVSGNTVTVTEGSASETLVIAGAAGDTFALASDGSGGTRLTNTAPSPIVSSGSTLTVSSGQTSSYLGVLSGGTLGVLAGGTVISTSLLGSEALRGVDSAGQVSSGGVLSVSAGGTVQGGSVLSSGAETVSSAGTVSGGMVASGGGLTVSTGGLVSGTAVHGTLTVLSGGIASATAISASGSNIFGAEEIVSGGQSVSATVGSGGELVVSGVTSTTYNGSAFVTTVATPSSASNTTVSAGGYLYVDAGGVTTGTVLLGSTSGTGSFTFAIVGEESVTGSALGTVVSSGGEQLVFSGGTTSGTVVVSGGTQILNGGTALNDVVSAGGIISAVSGTLAFTEAAGTTSSFVGTVTGSSTNNSLLVQSGPGTLALAGNLSGFTGSALISGGTLELTSAGAAGGASVDFKLGTSATLRVDGATGPTNTIYNFNTGDVIDLGGLAYAGTTAPSVSGNTVTVTEGSASETLVIAGASGDTFALASDGAGGTTVQIACYCRGTLILTDKGERSVESLAIGDHVITLGGVAEPVRWIGRRSYAGRFLAGRQHLLPIRIRAGALGGGLPRRDLRVSPNHAIFIDDVLIPAAHLVNGRSVVQDQQCSTVEYFHVELAAHCIILAEGAASESYLDDDNRGLFHNASEAVLSPRPTTLPSRYCAPRLESGFIVEAVRDRLLRLPESGGIQAA